jgi:hypothetical protein
MVDPELAQRGMTQNPGDRGVVSVGEPSKESDSSPIVLVPGATGRTLQLSRQSTRTLLVPLSVTVTDCGVVHSPAPPSKWGLRPATV